MTKLLQLYLFTLDTPSIWHTTWQNCCDSIYLHWRPLLSDIEHDIKWQNCCDSINLHWRPLLSDIQHDKTAATLFIYTGDPFYLTCNMTKLLRLYLLTLETPSIWHTTWQNCCDPIFSTGDPICLRYNMTKLLPPWRPHLSDIQHEKTAATLSIPLETPSLWHTTWQNCCDPIYSTGDPICRFYLLQKCSTFNSSVCGSMNK